MTKLSDEEVYRDKGFVLLKGFFSQEKMDEIRNDAKKIFVSQMVRLGLVASTPLNETAFEASMVDLFQKDLQSFTNCGKQAQHLISLHRLCLDQRITQRLSGFGLEFPNISTRPVLYFNSERLAKKEVYWRLSAHQDWRSMQGSLDSIVVWVPLMDISKTLGALEVIPGSHKRGLQDATIIDGYGKMQGTIDESDFIPLEIEKGDALFFSTFLVHRSGTNATNSIRWSCHFRYNNLRESTFIERGYPHPYIYKPQEELITPGFPTLKQMKKIFS